jgi:hypothetical protein
LKGLICGREEQKEWRRYGNRLAEFTRGLSNDRQKLSGSILEEECWQRVPWAMGSVVDGEAKWKLLVKSLGEKLEPIPSPKISSFRSGMGWEGVRPAFSEVGLFKGLREANVCLKQKSNHERQLYFNFCSFNVSLVLLIAQKDSLLLLCSEVSRDLLIVWMETDFLKDLEKRVE